MKTERGTSGETRRTWNEVTKETPAKPHIEELPPLSKYTVFVRAREKFHQTAVNAEMLGAQLKAQTAEHFGVPVDLQILKYNMGTHAQRWGKRKELQSPGL
jgi:hypothetical protein|mmetsp:Transcript_79760/g.133227  ORF Transcript_79760/g.133227 Transcript_79760/m.133227 type:complete len:101 (-) Transcript_79760:609-911(-)